jgi:pilus assembly protein TadC
MLALVLATATAGCFVLALTGWRLLRTSGLEALDLIPAQPGTDGSRQPWLARAIDAFGRRFERTVIRWYGGKRMQRLERRLTRAGRPEGMSARGFLRRKTGFGVIGALVFLGFWLSGYLLLGALVLAVFWWWMDLWLHAVIRKRQRRIDAELPDFLDILGVTVAAGLSFRTALARVADATSGPLSDEIRTTLREMDLGVPRRRAFTALRERNDAQSVAAFVTAVLQAEELGTPLSRALSEIAVEVRREFAQEARRQAAKAGPKVSLVVTTFIVPGAMLLIGATLVLSNLDRFQGVLG